MIPDRRFIEFLSDAIGRDNAETAVEALQLPPSVSVRFNPDKNSGVIDPGTVSSAMGTEAEQVPWSRYGFLLSERPVFTLDPLMHAGAYYIQDSSAMFPGHVFRHALERIGKDSPGPVKVLDLCAAPGGKTTDLAASLREIYGNGFLLVSNEVMKQRAAVLMDNAGIWGDPCVVVTSSDPADFGALPEFFDIIVADVPCSGEGMFRKDAGALEQWSPENVSACAARQKRIVADVWPALKPGGVLVYSTCTFNRYENDLNVAWTVRELGAEPLKTGADFPGLTGTEYGVSLVPGLVRGEGQYCAAVLKTAGSSAGNRPVKAVSRRNGKARADSTLKDRELFRKCFSCPVDLTVRGDLVIAVPETIAGLADELSPVHPLQRGTAAGQIKGKDIAPDADLALSLMLDRSAFPNVEVSREQALAFLHRDALTLPQAERGLVLLSYGGHPLGFVKNLGNRCNSFLPQHRRIRMDLEK